MSQRFSTSKLTLALIALSAAPLSQAAGLDRSGQDITAFLQSGTYAEASYTYIDADVTGADASGNKVDDIAEAYNFPRFGVKADVNDVLSVGVLYDEPWGAAAKYEGNNDFVEPESAQAQQIFQGAVANYREALQSQDPALIRQAASGVGIAQGIVDNAGQGTEVEVSSQNLTGLVGMKLGNNFQLYGGPALQKLEADVALRGPGYGASRGYEASISNDTAMGWVAGAAFMKPEIALKAALTYRSEIEHEGNAGEVFPAAGVVAGDAITITTPESVNFDFQTGINPTTLATAKVRYVPWGDFSIVPPAFNQVTTSAKYPNGLPLVAYSDDQWQVELGMAKRLSPAVAVSGSIGWDSGAGNPTTSLGPIEGYYSIGAGAKVNLDKNWAISAGGKYLMFGDADGALSSGTKVSSFEDNDGYVLGVKLSYQDK